MSEREKSDLLREDLLQKINEFLLARGEMVDRILSQDSPNALLLSTVDKDNNERYIEIKLIVKKPDYEPDDDISYFKDVMRDRAIKKVKAQINKLNKKEKLLAQANADELVRQELKKYGLENMKLN